MPGPPCGLVEPVEPAVLALLHRAVLDHATTERRRVHPPVVHVGTPGAVVAAFALGGERLDRTLRVDALEALVRRARRPGTPLLVWLTRGGSACDQHDVDLAWAAAARTAAAELDRPLPMVVVTRRCWRDPVSDVRREWARVRRR